MKKFLLLITIFILGLTIKINGYDSANDTGNNYHYNLSISVTSDKINIETDAPDYSIYGSSDGTNYEEISNGQHIDDIINASYGEKYYIRLEDKIGQIIQEGYEYLPDEKVAVDITDSVMLDSGIKIYWEDLSDTRVVGYKVVASESNTNPTYPTDGSFIYEKNNNYIIINIGDIYTDGDFSTFVEGKTYNFSITTVYSDGTKLSGNSKSIKMPTTVNLMTPTITYKAFDQGNLILTGNNQDEGVITEIYGGFGSASSKIGELDSNNELAKSMDYNGSDEYIYNIKPIAMYNGLEKEGATYSLNKPTQEPKIIDYSNTNTEVTVIWDEIKDARLLNYNVILNKDGSAYINREVDKTKTQETLQLNGAGNYELELEAVYEDEITNEIINLISNTKEFNVTKEYVSPEIIDTSITGDTLNASWNLIDDDRLIDYYVVLKKDTNVEFEGNISDNQITLAIDGAGSYELIVKANYENTDLVREDLESFIVAEKTQKEMIDFELSSNDDEIIVEFLTNKPINVEEVSIIKTENGTSKIVKTESNDFNSGYIYRYLPDTSSKYYFKLRLLYEDGTTKDSVQRSISVSLTDNTSSDTSSNFETYDSYEKDVMIKDIEVDNLNESINVNWNSKNQYKVEYYIVEILKDNQNISTTEISNKLTSKEFDLSDYEKGKYTFKINALYGDGKDADDTKNFHLEEINVDIDYEIKYIDNNIIVELDNRNSDIYEKVTLKIPDKEIIELKENINKIPYKVLKETEIILNIVLLNGEEYKYNKLLTPKIVDIIFDKPKITESYLEDGIKINIDNINRDKITKMYIKSSNGFIKDLNNGLKEIILLEGEIKSIPQRLKLYVEYGDKKLTSNALYYPNPKSLSEDELMKLYAKENFLEEYKLRVEKLIEERKILETNEEIEKTTISKDKEGNKTIKINNDDLDQTIEKLKEKLELEREEKKALLNEDDEEKLNKKIEENTYVKVKVNEDEDDEEIKLELEKESLENIRSENVGVELETNEVSMKLSSKVIKQNDFSNFKKISINKRKIKDSLNELDKKIEEKNKYQNKKRSKIYDLKIEGEDDLGKLKNIEKFNNDLKINIKLNEEELKGIKDPRKAGVYYVDEEGNLEYKGGVFLGDSLEFKTDHLSMYMVMEAEKTFEDVDEHWAKDEIEVLASRHIIKGVDENNFSPESKLTREQFATLVGRALNLKEEENDGTITFSDVEPGSYSEKHIYSLANKKILNGYLDSTFKPKNEISKEEMAVVLVKAIAYVQDKEIEELSGDIKGQFDDIDTSSFWAKKYIEKAKEMGLLESYNINNFKPLNKTKRAEAANGIYNLIDELNLF